MFPDLRLFHLVSCITSSDKNAKMVVALLLPGHGFSKRTNSRTSLFVRRRGHHNYGSIYQEPSLPSVFLLIINQNQLTMNYYAYINNIHVSYYPRIILRQ